VTRHQAPGYCSPPAYPAARPAQGGPASGGAQGPWGRQPALRRLAPAGLGGRPEGPDRPGPGGSRRRRHHQPPGHQGRADHRGHPVLLDVRRSEARAKAPGAAWKDTATLAHWEPRPWRGP